MTGATLSLYTPKEPVMQGKALSPLSSKEAAELLSSPGKSFSAYLQRVSRIPLLSVQEERALLLEVHENKNPEAAKVLTLSNLRFVAYVAKRYLGYGLPFEEMVQEGTLGLIKAIKRFDPKNEVRLATFAIYWIKEEIHEYILRNWRLMKVATTKAQRKLFFNLRKLRSKGESGPLSGEEAQRIANTLEVSLEDVHEMAQRMSAPELSLDQPLDEDSPKESVYAMIPSDDSGKLGHEEMLSRQDEAHTLRLALKQLDPRSRDILQSRYLGEEKATLSDLSAQYGISVERVRQIETKALKTLKSALS